MSNGEKAAILWEALDEKAARAVGGADVWPSLELALPILNLGRARVLNGMQGKVLFGALGVAVVAFLLLTQPRASQPPFVSAGWTAQPGPVDPALREQVTELCSDYDGGLHYLRAPLPPLVAIDQRGKSAIALFAGLGPNGEARQLTCTLTRFRIQGEEFWSAGGKGAGPEKPYQAPMTVDGPGATTGNQPRNIPITAETDLWGEPFSWLHGRVSEEVLEVVIERIDGPAVTATIEGDYFLAYWPGFPEGHTFNDSDIRVTAYGEGGAVLAVTDVFGKPIVE
jgi:hypothetical protein